MSFAMKSTIFTRKWLKEKGNDAYTYVSINVYTYTSMNEHYFITKHFFHLPFGSKSHSCKENGHYSYSWRCFLLCTIKYPHMNSEKRHVHTWKSSNGQPPLYRKFLWAWTLLQDNVHSWLVLLSHEMLVPTNWMTSCTHKRVTLGSPFMQKNPSLCWKFSFGDEPFSKQCSQLTNFPFECDIDIFNWITFCTHKK